MAEIAMAALGALGGGGAAAGTAVAGTAAAGTAAAGSAAIGSTILTALSGLATITSIIGTIQAGNAQAEATEISAIQTDIERGQEQVSSTQRQTVMKRELLRVLGENDVAFARAGIDISGNAGIVGSSRREIEQRATSELSIERSDDEFRRAMLKVRSDGLRRKAKGIRGGAMLSAIGQGLDFGISALQRG